MKNYFKRNLLFPIKKLLNVDTKSPQQSMIGIFLALVFVISVILAIIMVFSRMPSYWSLIIMACICMLGWLINRSKYVKILPFFLIIAILAVLQYNLCSGYGMHDIGIIAWPAVIFLCGLLFGAQAIPFVSILVLLLAIVTRFSPNANNFHTDTDTGDMVLMLIVLLSFSLVALLLIRKNESALHRLRQSEARSQAIFNSVNDVIFILDAKTGAILDVNNKIQEMFGYTSLEVIHLNFGIIGSGISPYQSQNTKEWLLKAATQGPQIFEWQAKDKTGRVFWVDINMKMANIGEQPQAVVSVRDITERKQAEAAILSLNSELEQRVAARTVALEATNKELEAFAYSVSHDLRTPLRALNGFSSILLEDYRNILDKPGQDYLMRIQKASTRMGQLINDLLNLSHITRMAFTRRTFDFSTLVQNILIELKMHTSQRQIKFEVVENLVVNGDQKMIKIVMENLLNNAIKFTSQRDVAIIRVGMIVQEENKRVYYVSDNGAGFDMAYSDKLFAPFQRLHGIRDFPGNGIGLAAVQRIISRHGGQIWAEGMVDQGATIYFTLGET